MEKSIVCIKQSLPKNITKECECLDLILALASFDYHIHLIFYGDGVISGLAGDTKYHQRLQALPWYDVTDIWIDQPSLSVRQLHEAPLALTMHPLDATQFNNLIANSAGVYTL